MAGRMAGSPRLPLRIPSPLRRSRGLASRVAGLRRHFRSVSPEFREGVEERSRIIRTSVAGSEEKFGVQQNEAAAQTRGSDPLESGNHAWTASAFKMREASCTVGRSTPSRHGRSGANFFIRLSLSCWLAWRQHRCPTGDSSFAGRRQRVVMNCPGCDALMDRGFPVCAWHWGISFWSTRSDVSFFSRKELEQIDLGRVEVLVRREHKQWWKAGAARPAGQWPSDRTGGTHIPCLADLRMLKSPRAVPSDQFDMPVNRFEMLNQKNAWRS